MISYGDAIKWCIQKQAVMRFVNQDTRPEFVVNNHRGGVALELAITIEDKTVAAHSPMDMTAEPSKAVAIALIACVQYFVERNPSRLVRP